MRFAAPHTQSAIRFFYSADCDAGSIKIHAYNVAHFQDKCLM